MTMSDSFTRRNSADQDKKLDALWGTIGGLDIFRPRVAIGNGALGEGDLTLF